MRCAQLLIVLFALIFARAGMAQGQDSATAHLLVAEIALQRGQSHVAAQEYAKAAQLSSNAKLAEQATRVAFESRQETIAAQCARRWLELSPGNLDGQRYLAVVSLRQFAVDESVRQFERLLRSAYKTPGAGFLDLSGTLAQEESTYAVLSVMQGLGTRFPNVAEARYAVGVASLRAYNYSRAIENARAALKLKPQFPEAEQLLSRALVVSGQTEAGLTLARARAAGGDTQARLEMALLLAGSGQAEAARTELTSLLDVAEARPEALHTLASIDLSEGKLDDAARRFTDLLTTGRHVSFAFYSLGTIHERQRDPLRAVRYYTRIDGGQYASEAQLRAARLLVNNGARDQANALLDAYVAGHPAAYIDIAIGRAQLLTDEGDAGAALKTIEEAQRRYPDSEELHFAHSMTLDRAGRSAEAVAELRAVLERRPEDPVALNALGYTLAEYKRSLREAETLVRKALEKTPDNPAVQDSTGWVLHRLGQNPEALKWLERAYSGTKNAEIAAHIGEVYWTLGERGKARQIWQAALAAEPNHRYLLRTLRRYPE